MFILKTNIIRGFLSVIRLVQVPNVMTIKHRTITLTAKTSTYVKKTSMTIILMKKNDPTEPQYETSTEQNLP